MTQGLVAINSWTFLAQMLNLLIQIVLIRKFLLKPIKEVIAKRKAISDEELAVARKSRAEAEAMKAEYESSIANAKAEANEIIQTAQKAADTRGEEIVAAAEKHAASIKAKAETDIEQMSSRTRSAALPWIWPARSLSVKSAKRTIRL